MLHKIEILISIICTIIFLSNSSSYSLENSIDPYQPNIPSDLSIKVEEARELRLDEKFIESQKILEDVILKQPNYFRAHYNLGIVYSNLDLDNKAIIEFEEAIKIREKDNIDEYSIYNTAGWFYMSLGNYDMAEKYFKKGLEFKDQNSESTNQKLYNNLGLLYYKKFELDSARKYLTISIDEYNSTSAKKTLELVELSEKKEKDFEAKQNELKNELKAVQQEQLKQ